MKAEKAQFTSDVSDVDNYTKKPKIKLLNKSAAAVFEKKSSLAPGTFIWNIYQTYIIYLLAHLLLEIV